MAASRRVATRYTVSSQDQERQERQESQESQERQIAVRLRLERWFWWVVRQHARPAADDALSAASRRCLQAVSATQQLAAYVQHQADMCWSRMVASVLDFFTKKEGVYPHQRLQEFLLQAMILQKEEDEVSLPFILVVIAIHMSNHGALSYIIGSVRTCFLVNAVLLRCLHPSRSHADAPVATTTTTPTTSREEAPPLFSSALNASAPNSTAPPNDVEDWTSNVMLKYCTLPLCSEKRKTVQELCRRIVVAASTDAQIELIVEFHAQAVPPSAVRGMFTLPAVVVTA